MADNLEDTCLDNPRAGGEFPAIVSAAQKQGWLESSFEVRLWLVACSLRIQML